LVKKKAVMIGAGLANLAAAVYLIQEGHWNGDAITFYSLDDHGSNDGSTTSEAADDYWSQQHPLENTRGYLARGGRMLNYRTYVDLMDLLERIPSATESGLTAAQDTYEFDAAHPTFDKARLMEGGKGIIAAGHLGLNNTDRLLLTKLIMMPDEMKKSLIIFRLPSILSIHHIFFKQTSGICGRQPLPFVYKVRHKNYAVICIR
jgi:oleate hydratase